ncbi:MAG: SgcJ/EcaC family oxidoreductase [Pseudomonadota bacterium]|nr:SgcJ/EcaC family oxidoreductase [Pseudomonadota bacterium]
MITSPQLLQAALAEAFNARDIDAMTVLFVVDGTLVPKPGVLSSGHAEIREALTGFLGVPGTMTIDTVEVVETNNMALSKTSWRIENEGEVAMAGNGIEVMRKEADGQWRFLIDHPFGGD